MIPGYKLVPSPHAKVSIKTSCCAAENIRKFLSTENVHGIFSSYSSGSDIQNLEFTCAIQLLSPLRAFVAEEGQLEIFELYQPQILSADEKCLDKERFKCLVFCPDDTAAEVCHAIGYAGAGVIGKYSYCSFSVSGELNMDCIPIKGVRVETVCPGTIINAIMQALKGIIAVNEGLRVEFLRQLVDDYTGEGVARLSVFAPITHAAACCQAMAKKAFVRRTSPAKCFAIEGVGHWLALEGAKPAFGSVGILAAEKEIRIDVVCDKHCLLDVLSAARESHCYEEIGYDIYALHPELHL